MQTPPYAAYPRPLPPKGVRIDAIFQEAWQLIKADLGTWVLTTLVFFVCFAVVYGLMMGIDVMLGFGASDVRPFNPLSLILTYVVAFLANGVYLTLIAGMAHMGIKQAMGQSYGLSDLFAATPRIGTVIVATFLTLILVYIGMIACLLPGLVVNGLLFLTPLIIFMQGKGPVEAMKLSWETLKPYLWPATGFAIAFPIVAGIGVLLCGVGILLTFPFYPIGMGLLYRDMFMRTDDLVATGPIDGIPPMDSPYQRPPSP
ncbi:MAG TPA: hypothetical protein VGE01_00235 [Fimbriimonas sp.]